ncbi:MAG: hypothetical protein SNJ72_09400 [Fimbriimonadales bacterium]
MDWGPFLSVVSALVGWTFILTRQMLQRMDRVVETAQRQEQAITEEFITYLRESVERTEATYERLETALEQVQDALVALRYALQEWTTRYKA